MPRPPPWLAPHDPLGLSFGVASGVYPEPWARDTDLALSVVGGNGLSPLPWKARSLRSVCLVATTGGQGPLICCDIWLPFLPSLGLTGAVRSSRQRRHFPGTLMRGRGPLCVSTQLPGG